MVTLNTLTKRIQINRKCKNQNDATIHLRSDASVFEKLIPMYQSVNNNATVAKIDTLDRQS